MRIPRIYVDQTLGLNHLITLDKTATRHIHQVLRLSVGDSVILFNGHGGEYTGHIHALEKNLTQVEVDRFEAKEVESPLSLHLAQGLLRHEKMDFVIQKAVELGVKSITPLFTERTAIKLAEARTEKRIERWQSIIRSACEQCGRNQLPVLYPPIAFSSWMPQPASIQKILLHPQATQTIHTLPESLKEIQLIIGPEGGLSQDEIDFAAKHGALCMKLGPRILRTETAPLAALSILQALRGDL